MDIDHRFGVRFTLKGSSGPFFGPGVVRLLCHVRSGLSLNKAAQEMGMAYSKAWRIIKEAEKEFGFSLLESSIGGKDGGGSRLTRRGELILDAYLVIENQLLEIAEKLYMHHIKPVLNPPM
ncbi:MAG TPA: LysR family transcriptional regulator [Sphaerochaeta sp.]|nr:LysR family transcriptional regulator [Spirochaetota bacterium]NLL24502.1 LysR family transcriptional regulator [Spirochaetales bacterium]HPK64539.1 LysR family transcriptional regulator [Sphaerochaeta sp.]